MRNLALTLVLVGCAPTPSPSPPNHPVPAGALTVCENCVGSFSGWSLAASDFGEHDAELTFWFAEGPVKRIKHAIVGTTFALGAMTYEVIEIDHHDVPGLVVLRSVTRAPSSPPPDTRVTFGATSMRIDVRPIELTHLEARWDRNGVLAVELHSESQHATRIALWFRIDKSTLPGGAGRFEATAQSAGLESRACKVTGSISAPTIPTKLTKEGEPFDFDLDVTLDDCEPESVLAPLILRGHVQMQLSRALPPEL